MSTFLPYQNIFHIVCTTNGCRELARYKRENVSNIREGELIHDYACDEHEQVARTRNAVDALPETHKTALIAELTKLYQATVEEMDKLPKPENEGVTPDAFDVRASLQGRRDTFDEVFILLGVPVGSMSYYVADRKGRKP